MVEMVMMVVVAKMVVMMVVVMAVMMMITVQSGDDIQANLSFDQLPHLGLLIDALPPSLLLVCT